MTYYLYSLGFFAEAPSGDIARYAVCRPPLFVLCPFVPGTSHALLFHWHYGVRTIDYFWSPIPCYVLCFFVPRTLTYADFLLGDNGILYADDRRHSGFLGT